jgi:hypothetical protein
MRLTHIELVADIFVRQKDCGDGIGVIAMKITCEYYASCFSHVSDYVARCSDVATRGY